MSKTKEVKTNAPKITKSMQVIGESKESAFEKLFNAENPPEIKSVGTVHVPGTNTHISFVMTTKGKEIISIDVDEPNLRAIAEETSKINFVNLFMNLQDD